jgi:hypothetical protein
LSTIWDHPAVRDRLKVARAPGRIGVGAATQLLDVLPQELWPEVLVRLWHDPPHNRLAWSSMFCFAWRQSSWRIRQLAGSRDRVVRMIEAAAWDEFQLPVARLVTGYRADLPATFTVYRGGLAPAEELAAGLCWTRDVRVAGHFARWRREQVGGTAAVVKRVVRREDVLWTWRVDAAEHLIAEPGPWRLVTDDSRRIDSLGRASFPVIKATTKALVASVPCSEYPRDPWGGWTGEESVPAR